MANISSFLFTCPRKVRICYVCYPFGYGGSLIRFTRKINSPYGHRKGRRFTAMWEAREMTFQPATVHQDIVPHNYRINELSA